MNWYVRAQTVPPVDPASGVSYQKYLNDNHANKDWTNEKPADEKKKEKKSQEPGKGENIDVVALRACGLTKTAGLRKEAHRPTVASCGHVAGTCRCRSKR